ncbi:hypothetical protein L2E82_38366 [Cichorium intybus]|uniref:Uncharacterized protein n=1 Tax=Cichorium intybus TaxID=13427 RepID=A0ACB9AHL7_CICIN|nr:hypothetical protein L2E82_38366 [Cichorium intybus]
MFNNIALKQPRKYESQSLGSSSRKTSSLRYRRDNELSRNGVYIHKSSSEYQPNQDFHSKLQQQQLAMLFGGGEEHDYQPHQQKETGLRPILFQNLEILMPEASSIDGVSRKVVAAVEWRQRR